MTSCTCHPKEEQLLDRLGANRTLKIAEMVQRTIDHSIMLITKEQQELNDPPLKEQDFDIDVWTQDVWNPTTDKHERKRFVVISYPVTDERRDFFISVDGCEPKYIRYPGSLFFAAVQARHLSGDFNDEEYWEAVQVGEF